MSDMVVLGRKDDQTVAVQRDVSVTEGVKSRVPEYEMLADGFTEANRLVDDIVLKKYLHRLTDFEIVPLDDQYKQISDIRIFKITEMVYQNNEYSTYKFASVFNAVQNLNCSIFIILDSNGQKTDFYMGVRSLDDKRTTKSLKNTLRNALCGQFPGVQTKDLLDPEAEDFLSNIATKNVSIVSCVAKNKDENFKDNESYIQGLEKLALAMQGQIYTAVVLAKSTPAEQMEEIRHAYETIYTQLSPFANMQVSYGTNMALNVSEAFSHSTTSGSSHSISTSVQKGASDSTGSSDSHSTTKADTLGTLVKGLGTAALGIASLVAAPLTGGASIAAAGAITVGQMSLNSFTPKSTADGRSISKNHSENYSESQGVTDSTNESLTKGQSSTQGITRGSSDNVNLTVQNKSLLNTLEKIDVQLRRMDECESIGMWECAAYFLSDSQETVEMAAGTYKALMKGEKSGIETSAVNFWGRRKTKELPVLREYIKNFVHPVFTYNLENVTVPVTAASLLSSNELAIQMGLPRKSVCGFPVIKHADFGKEVVRYGHNLDSKKFSLGNVFCMGKKTNTEVGLDSFSLTMHTFVTGSTGAGKSNTIYEILNQLKNMYKIPFLVIEPAKGEYKNVFGQFPDVTVYGTNPEISDLLRLNPFRFPQGVHVLEHLDRLVEIFNVCWPMYAAMPAILKEAMEKAYVATGWNLTTSKNRNGEKFPGFLDLLEQIEMVIQKSQYSSDSKNDYSGALLTRVRSLTNGLNGLIFCNHDLNDSDLFDKNVIVDLSRVGSTETKSLIMGLLVMRLQEYRMSFGKINSPLDHITVLEEAHNLLKRVSTEQSSETANLLGKSVELLANSIAEMRTYGEGFIIADQSPGLLDMSVIRNTNTKIILRLPDHGDRELVGRAAGLNEEQIDELSKLKCGVAAVYQNDWIEPVLVQINKCDIQEKLYESKDKIINIDSSDLLFQLVNFLIHGRMDEKANFSIEVIEKELENMQLSSLEYEFIKGQIDEYKRNKSLELWNDENFGILSRKITDILSVRSYVERCVLMAADNSELSAALTKMTRGFFPNASDGLILTLSQCMMKDMSIQQEETEVRQQIYRNWVKSIREGS